MKLTDFIIDQEDLKKQVMELEEAVFHKGFYTAIKYIALLDRNDRRALENKSEDEVRKLTLKMFYEVRDFLKRQGATSAWK